jgi:uncharacterized protein
MNIKMLARSAVLGTALLGFAGAMPATAQTVALATTQGGATEQIANAIAQVVTTESPLQVRPQILANTSQYVPLVNDGRIEFGIANYPQTHYALEGTGMSPGQAMDDIRIVATLFPFSAGLVVTEESGMTGYADLAGKRVPRFPENSLGDFIIGAALASADLTYDDVTSVPTANFPRMYDSMKQNQTDVSIAAVGAQPTYDLESTLNGIRFLSFEEGQEETVAEYLPGTYLRTMPESAHGLPGMSAETVVFAYDYMLFAHKDVPNETVAHFVKALHSGEEGLKATSPLWAEYNPADLGKRTDMPFHEGAAEALRELGIFEN